MGLADHAGRRLYLTMAERQAFLRVSAACSPEVRSFCLTLLHTGCRISEALALTVDRVDHGAGMLIFESLKKRRRGVYRSVPVPDDLLGAIALMETPDNERVWPWPRRSAYRHVKQVMAAAGITGPQASPKGLRHGFAVACLEQKIALNMVQKWLGHASMVTTAIYLNAVGAEERSLAARLWNI